MEPAELHDAEAVATFRPRHDHVGAADTVHGGLAATVLDEIMVWAGILVERVLTVTGTMELRYRRPLSVNDEIVARGTVTERRGRRLRCAGTLEVEGGPAVTATGLYLVVREFSASESATE